MSYRFKYYKVENTWEHIPVEISFQNYILKNIEILDEDGYSWIKDGKLKIDNKKLIKEGKAERFEIKLVGPIGLDELLKVIQNGFVLKIILYIDEGKPDKVSKVSDRFNVSIETPEILDTRLCMAGSDSGYEDMFLCACIRFPQQVSVTQKELETIQKSIRFSYDGRQIDFENETFAADKWRTIRASQLLNLDKLNSLENKIVSVTANFGGNIISKNIVLPEEILSSTKFEKEKKLLKDAADKAYENHPDNCNKSTAETLNILGIQDLKENMTANDQIDYMERNWETVSAYRAQNLANRGVVVVAGLKEIGHGHTAVVVPGEPVTKKNENCYVDYPMVEGGAMNVIARSKGDLSAGDVWGKLKRVRVKYYTPK